MKSTIIKILMLVFVIVTISACSSDDDSAPNYTEENFLAGYLEATGFDEGLSWHDLLDGYRAEIGIDFTPKVRGKITALKVMLPDAMQSLRVTIWDKATTTVLRTEMVNVASENTEFTFDITDLELVKDKEYAITMNTIYYYIRRRTDDSDATYPVTIGNIQINAFRRIFAIGSENQTYPTNSFPNFYFGDLSFDFIQTE